MTAPRFGPWSWLVASTLVLAPAAAGQTCEFGEPATPDCTAPRIISGLPGQHVVLMDATTSTTSMNLCGVPSSNAVWFLVTPSVSGPMTISTCHPNTSYDTVLEIYEGGDLACTTLPLAACNDDDIVAQCANECSGFASSVTVAATAGRRYQFVIGAFNDNSANCPLCLGVIVTIGTPCGDPPRNFACNPGIAELVPGVPGVFESTIDAADAFETLSLPAACVDKLSGHALWYQLTPTIDGLVTFTTCHQNTQYDTVVAAFESSDGGCSSLVDVACNDDAYPPGCEDGCTAPTRGSAIQFNVSTGVTYYLVIGSYDQNSANCPLCVGATLELIAGACVGDVDRDGTVAVNDLLDLLAQWGPCGSTCGADLQYDGSVNVNDLLDLLAAWGPCF